MFKKRPKRSTTTAARRTEEIGETESKIEQLESVPPKHKKGFIKYSLQELEEMYGRTLDATIVGETTLEDLENEENRLPEQLSTAKEDPMYGREYEEVQDKHSAFDTEGSDVFENSEDSWNNYQYGRANFMNDFSKLNSYRYTELREVSPSLQEVRNEIRDHITLLLEQKAKLEQEVTLST